MEVFEVSSCVTTFTSLLKPLWCEVQAALRWNKQLFVSRKGAMHISQLWKHYIPLNFKGAVNTHDQKQERHVISDRNASCFLFVHQWCCPRWSAGEWAVRSGLGLCVGQFGQCHRSSSGWQGKRFPGSEGVTGRAQAPGSRGTAGSAGRCWVRTFTCQKWHFCPHLLSLVLCLCDLKLHTLLWNMLTKSCCCSRYLLKSPYIDRTRIGVFGRVSHGLSITHGCCIDRNTVPSSYFHIRLSAGLWRIYRTSSD